MSGLKFTVQAGELWNEGGTKEGTICGFAPLPETINSDETSF
jgi:hypothetical protein